MRAYIADLAAYNEGTLTGEWIDLEGKDADDIQGEITALLTKWGREEYAVHDWEGPKALTSMGEHPDWEEIATFVIGFEEHGEAFGLWWDNDGYNRDADKFEEQYQGCFPSLADYAENWFDGTGELEKCGTLAQYFDFERWGRDYELGGDIWTERGSEGLHVFDNH